MDSLVNGAVGNYAKIRDIIESRGNNPNWIPELLAKISSEVGVNASLDGKDTYQTILRVLADVEKVERAYLAESTEIEKTKAVLSAIQAMKDYATIRLSLTRHHGLIQPLLAWVSRMFSCFSKTAQPAVLTAAAPSEPVSSPEPVTASSAPVAEPAPAPAVEPAAAAAAPAPLRQDSDPLPALPESPPSSDNSSDEKL
jgi:hypothetical protein